MRFRRISDAALALACALIILHVGLQRYPRIPDQPTSVYQPGSIIEDKADLGLGKARRTLLMLTASTCHFCTASMPFYRKMVPAAKQADVRVVGVTTEDLSANQAYLAFNGIEIDAVASAAQNNISVHGTPTLLLLRNDGRVIASWQGKLSARQEEDVLSALGAAK
ncbi:MAG TPA: hypothetical protein VI636_19525 [Candidatus Angelobacter sp.]